MTVQESDEREPRLSYAERAYRAIKRRILDNEIPAGAVVLEQELVAMLGVSRTPVREALVRLAEEGMVEIRPRHGMRVLPLSADDMQEIYQILTALESEAAAQLARDGLSGDALARLTAVLEEMEAALAADDLDAWAQGDDRFHRLLLGYCSNARLTGIILQFWDQSHRARTLTLRLRPRPDGSNEDHRALVDAIARRDADAAQRIHREHRTVHGRLLSGLLRRHGLTQL